MLDPADPCRCNEVPLSKREYLRYVYEKIHEYKREQRLREAKGELDKESDINSFEDPVENRAHLPASPPVSATSSKKVNEIHVLRKSKVSPRPFSSRFERRNDYGREVNRRDFDRRKNEGNIRDAKFSRFRTEWGRTVQPTAKSTQPPANMRGGPAFQNNGCPPRARDYNSVSSQNEKSTEKKLESQNESRNDAHKKDKDPKKHRDSKAEKVSPKKRVKNEDSGKNSKDNMGKSQEPEKLVTTEENGNKSSRPSSKQFQYGKFDFNVKATEFRSGSQSRNSKNSAPPRRGRGGSPSIFTYAPLQSMQPQAPNMPAGFQYVHSYNEPPIIPMDPMSAPQFVAVPPPGFPPQQFSGPVQPPTVVYTTPQMIPQPHLNHPYQTVFAPGHPQPVAMQYSVANHPPQQFCPSQQFYASPGPNPEYYGPY